MTDPHVRSERVLDPGYLSRLDELSDDELHEMHSECVELETEVSYVRRLTQARIDILDAEIERRSKGQTLEDLIRALPQILADQGPRADPARSRLPLQLAPEQESEWAPDLAAFDGVFADLPSIEQEEILAAMERLKTLERSVSDERRSLFKVIDRIDQGLAEHQKPT